MKINIATNALISISEKSFPNLLFGIRGKIENKKATKFKISIWKFRGSFIKIKAYYGFKTTLNLALLLIILS